MKNIKTIVMPRTEELKKLLEAQYQVEYEEYQQLCQIQHQQEMARAEEDRLKRMKLEGESLRKEISKYHDEKAKTVQMQRDLELAMWEQLKINQTSDFTYNRN